MTARELERLVVALRQELAALRTDHESLALTVRDLEQRPTSEREAERGALLEAHRQRVGLYRGQAA